MATWMQGKVGPVPSCPWKGLFSAAQEHDSHLGAAEGVNLAKVSVMGYRSNSRWLEKQSFKPARLPVCFGH